MDKKLNAQLDRFIKSGFKLSCFTNDLYEMLYIESNRFIAHFDRRGFHAVRFCCNAENTIHQLRQVSKSDLKPLCLKLADSMERSLTKRVDTTFSYTVVTETTKRGA